MSPETNKEKDLATFLADGKKELFLGGIISGSYFLVMVAFRLPWKINLYGLILALAAVTLFLWVDYRRYLKQLQQIRADQLPDGLLRLEKELGHRWKEAEELLVKNKQKDLRTLREMEDFYTLWAHQIKTPIAGIKLILDPLEGEEEEVLKSEIFRIEEYVQIMMAYLRLGKEGGDYVFESCHVDEILRESIRKYAHLFIRKGIRLTFEGGDHKVLSDSKWLGLIFDQLLSNSLKYTKKGSIKIRWIEDHILSIKDTGIGIPPQDLPRVMELGYTGYNGRIYTASSGVGLYLCHRAMKNLGGNLEVRSSLGKGTEILLTFSKELM